jgi:CHASE2 domain-containing sensor protein/two-component sensor histidine kinase
MAAPRVKGRRLILEWALTAAVSSLLVAFLALGGLVQRADGLVYDLLSRAGTHAPRDDIVIVAIDNRSIEALGRWPWPRARHAALLQRLAAARPKAIAYDVLFLEPDRANDAALAGAMRAAAPLLLPLSFDVPGEDGAPFRLHEPVEPLRSAAAALGQVNLEFDPDGVVRRVMLAEDDGKHSWPHLMELAYRAVRGAPSPAYLQSAPPPAGPPASGGLRRSRPMLIPYAGPAGRFRTIAFSDVLSGDTPADFLRGKIVLVGATADGLGDRYSTPLFDGAQGMAGVEVQANVLDTLLSNRPITALPMVGVLAFSLGPLWILLFGVLRLRPAANMALGAGLLAATLALSAALLLDARVWAPPAAALAGLVFVYPFWSWRRLAAASAYMVGELKRFSDEPELLPAAVRPARGPFGGDGITREMDLMQGAVERMRELRRFVTLSLQGLPDATLVVGLDGRVGLANRAAEQLFEALTGAPPDGCMLEDLLAAFAPSPDAEDEAQALGASYQVRRTPLQGAGDQAIGWIVRFTDISALKAAGRQREQVLQLLTHDMRSPQVSILSLLHQAEDQTSPALAARIEGYARRTLALADDFVHLARAEDAPLDLEVLNLADLALDAADDLWPQATAGGVTLEARLTGEEFLVRADRSLMTRVLINLIGNAVKYTDTGGRVDCRVSREDGRIVCTIADTGRGMGPEQLGRLFRRFDRGGPPEKGKADGAGLGLAFVEAVVHRHQGTIACDSRPGEGSTFRLSLAEAQG